jgi:hypothetical protein
MIPSEGKPICIPSDYSNISNVLEMLTGLNDEYVKINTLRELLYPSHETKEAGLKWTKEQRIAKREAIKTLLSKEDELIDELTDLEEEYIARILAVQKRFLYELHIITGQPVIIKNNQLIVNQMPSNQMPSNQMPPNKTHIDNCVKHALYLITTVPKLSLYTITEKYATKDFIEKIKDHYETIIVLQD